MAVDIGMVCMASFLGLFIRFDLNMERIPAEYIRAVWMYLPFYVALATILVFFSLADVCHDVERGGIRGSRAHRRCLRAGVVDSDCRDADAGIKVPRSYFVLSFMALCRRRVVRLSYRILTIHIARKTSKRRQPGADCREPGRAGQ